jgi:hypothetical protein
MSPSRLANREYVRLRCGQRPDDIRNRMVDPGSAKVYTSLVCRCLSRLTAAASRAHTTSADSTSG